MDGVGVNVEQAGGVSPPARAVIGHLTSVDAAVLEPDANQRPLGMLVYERWLKPVSGTERAVFAYGSGNGLVVIARRLMATGLIPREDPGQA